MEIRVTDKELLEKTGGIIQGMSGSPIIQNGKFIGAVTHVLSCNTRFGKQPRRRLWSFCRYNDKTIKRSDVIIFKTVVICYCFSLNY